jgi:ParB family transcriptional regulator, chromosome partitioning protein
MNKLTAQNNSQLQWVGIDKIFPNPLNPRKNDSVKTEEMQEIIKKRGWEMPITVYRKGEVYIVLGGHRRLYSAREAGIKKIPVYIVEAPLSYQDEMERIADLQRGHEDWSVFEWAKFTYDRWITWGKPLISDFAKMIGRPERTVKSYLTVMDYFPLVEIESGLNNKDFTISSLFDFVQWMKALRKNHPTLVDTMGEELIRKTILEKVRLGLMERDELRRTEFLKLVDTDSIRKFIVSNNMKYDRLLAIHNIDLRKKTFHGSMVSLGMLNKSVKTIEPRTSDQLGRAVDTLTELKQQIELKIKELENKSSEF